MVDRSAGRICTHLQLQYRGTPASLGWVVPVPGEPVIAESDDALFRALDDVTRLEVVPPPFDLSLCDEGGSGNTGCGCGSPGAAKGGGGGPDTSVDPRAPVTVYSNIHTESYEGFVVGGTDAGALVEWLGENGFHLGASQRPVIEAYVREGVKFAASALRDGKTAADTVPVVLCYDAAAPALPLRLAAVAASPRMGVSVYVLSDVTFDLAGGGAIAPDPEGIVYDPTTGRTNDFEWVARTADESDGHTYAIERRTHGRRSGLRPRARTHDARRPHRSVVAARHSGLGADVRPRSGGRAPTACVRPAPWRRRSPGRMRSFVPSARRAGRRSPPRSIPARGMPAAPASACPKGAFPPASATRGRGHSSTPGSG